MTATLTPVLVAPTAPAERGLFGWLPSGAMISTKILDLRRRRGLMAMMVVLTVGFCVIFLGLRLLFHAVDPKSYGPAGSPGIFSDLSDTFGEFGFIAAAALGATAGTTDLSEGVFRHLVVTGRSRLSLYLARIPAGLAIVLPLVAVAFFFLCLVTSFAGTPNPDVIQIGGGVTISTHLDAAQLHQWALAHPKQIYEAFGTGPPTAAAAAQAFVDHHWHQIQSAYQSAVVRTANPAVNEMVKVGLWLMLEAGIGFLVGLGLGSLLGQRMVATVIMIVLEIILTPLMADHVIPYFLNGQRLIVGVAMDQLRPVALAAAVASGGHGGRVLLGRGSLQIPPMPTWAMVTVIVGWIVGWSVIGAWRMSTRDA